LFITVGVVIELAYAAAELQEGITGENYLKEYVFQGNEEAYAMTLMVTELAVGALTIVGGIINAKQAAKAAQGLSSGCFIAGTAVLTAVGVVAIEAIEVGDLVLSYNEETGENEYKEVVQLFRYEKTELIHLKLKDGQEIKATTEHPFYVANEGNWFAAKDLRAGDILRYVNGETVIVEWIQHEILENKIIVYNFEVADNHTYYVAQDINVLIQEFVLVHNSCRGNAVKKAWKRELNDVNNGGKGVTRTWTDDEIVQLKAKGKVDGYFGHHMKSVKGYPNSTGDPLNIQFLTRNEHLAAHGGNWRNVTHGPYLGG
jgi:hypothetical protein